MISFTSLDGGELAKVSDETLFDFPLNAIKVAYVLKDLAKILNEHKFNKTRPNYGFSLPLDQQKRIQGLMDSIERILPKGVSWYEIDGRKLFEMRGPSGGIASSLVCYLIALEEK